MKLIREFSEDVIIEEVINEETKEKAWYIKGITLQADVKNKNGRIYPLPVLEKAVNEYIENEIKNNTVFSAGELTHPEINPHIVNMENITHRFVEIKKEGSNFIAKAKVLDTPKGKIVQNLLKEGIKIGISSRGLGEVIREDDAFIVKNFKLITAGDLVSNPSAPDAFVEGIMEDAEWIYENGKIVKKEIPMEKYKKIIKEAKKQEIQKAIETVFADYLKRILL